MNVALVYAPWAYDRGRRMEQPYIGFAYMASVLRNAHHNVQIIDGQLGRFSTKVDDVVKKIVEIKPDLIGISCTSNDRFTAIEIINTIKTILPDALIAAGGPHFTYTAKDALENIPGLDVVVIGEGEYTMLELVACFENKGDLKNVNGIAFTSRDGEYIETEKRPLADLNNLPMGAWDLFEMDRYNGPMSAESRTRAIGISSGRGCPFSCAFCSNSLNKIVRYKEPVLFVDEVEYLYKKYGWTAFNFQDDTFALKASHTVAICEELLKRNLKIKWYCSPRVTVVTRELLELMKRAGCVALGFGIESGTDEVLKNIHKGQTTEQVRNAIKIVGEVGIENVVLFKIIGLPGETLDTIDRSIKFYEELAGYLPKNKSRGETSIGQLPVIYPKTELESIAIRNGNCLPKGFSWNKPYSYPKADVFGVAPVVPHFENPDLPVDVIHTYLTRKHFKIRLRNLFYHLKTMRTLKEYKMLFHAGVRHTKSLFKRI